MATTYSGDYEGPDKPFVIAFSENNCENCIAASSEWLIA
jgi:hypothetical protein